jgi:phosphoserine aminotransferase
MTTPTRKPRNKSFGSGPCAKRPDWSFDALDTDILGRSHRSVLGKKRLKEVIDRTAALLDLPEGYKIGITPASDTGAVELALWNLLGAEGVGVDVFAWEQFSQLWYQDIVDELPLEDVRAFSAEYGEIPDLSEIDPDRDSVFVWNGTTSGVRIPDNFKFPPRGKGLRICDATSATFAYELPWKDLDVVTWSWQKVMGGEAQHGMIVMSPEAQRRLAEHVPKWPMPQIFRLREKSGTPVWTFFEGNVINTPSMMAVSDALDVLRWMEKIGGRKEIQNRVKKNAQALDNWVKKTDWVSYLCVDETARSMTSVCLNISGADPKKLADSIVDLLEKEEAAFDLKAYKTAPPGLRIWCGGTVEAEDIEILTEWLDWAYAQYA